MKLNVCIFKPLSLGLFLTQQHISNTDKNIINTDSIEDIMIYCGREDKGRNISIELLYGLALE